MSKLLYYIKSEDHSAEKLREILGANTNIKFVSLMGVDLGGNATDEKIPVSLFLNDIDSFLKGSIQTDGSSVELHNIATLNNAKVDLKDRKSTRLNSSHANISYAVFCLKKKKKKHKQHYIKNKRS